MDFHLQFKDTNFDLFLVFFASLGATWVGLLGVSHYSRARSHSTLRFWNELLARTQIVSAAFYFTVSRTVTFIPDGKRFESLLTLVPFLAFGFWAISLNQVRLQEAKIVKHRCKLDEYGVCKKKLSMKIIRNVLFMNVLLVVITAIIVALVIGNPYMSQR